MSHLTHIQIQGMADGSISEPDRSAIQQHLAGCASCAHELSEQKALVAAIRQAPVIRPSRQFTRNVMEQILPGSQESKLLRFLGGTGKILAMGVVLAMIGFALTRSWTGTTTETRSQSQSEVTKVISQYYHQAEQFLLTNSAKFGQSVAQQGGTEQWKVLLMTLLSLISLALLDRYVFRRFLKLKL